MATFLDDLLAQISGSLQIDGLVPALSLFASRLVVAGVVLLAYYAAWRLASLLIRKVLGRTRVDATAVAFVLMLVKYTLMAMGTVHALGRVGIDTAAMLTSLGIAGLTIGFAARDALSNIISGFFIFWDRPFVLGDLVETGGNYGRVDSITLRSTRIVTPDGRMLSVPNSEILNGTVASYTNFPNLRIAIEVQIGVAESIARVRDLLLGTVQDRAVFMADPPPDVVVTALGDYNISVEVRAWLHDERVHLAERAALRERVFETLNEAGVDMPYETIQLRPLDVRKVA